MPRRLPTFIITHPEHGDCIGDEFALSVRVSRDDRWRRAVGEVSVDDDPVVLVDDQQMSELPSVGYDSLEDAVDDRALPHLRDAGIETMEDLVEYARDFRDVLIDVPYITERTLKKLGL